MKRDLQRCADTYKLEAERVGLEYLGASDRANHYRKYRKIDCRHELNLIPANVRLNQYNCKVCQQEKFLNEAKIAGLILVKRITRHKYLYNLPCGHEQEIHLSAVRNNEWMCRKCNASYFDLPSNIYLLKISSNNFTWLKLGYSRNLKIRIRSYKLVDSTIEVVLLKPVKSGRLAIQIEQQTHSEFFNQRLDPELMKRYHTQDGYTECYPIELLSSLVSQLLTKLSDIN